MRNRHWSPSGAPGSRIMLIAVPLVIMMAVGLVLGLRLVSEKNASVQLPAHGTGAATATPYQLTGPNGKPPTSAATAPTSR
jgi:hypothetical protein